MITAALVLWLGGPPAPASETLELPAREASEPEISESGDESASPEPPAPKLVPSEATPVVPPPRIRRCLPEVDPCVRTTSSRLLLGGLGLLTSATSLSLALIVSDRQRIGDPALPLAAAGMIAITSAVLGGTAAGLGGDGPTLVDRITPATVAIGVGVSSSTVTGERDPSSMSASFAPTWRFQHGLGRLRLVGSVGGRLGSKLAGDPRPQTSNGDGSFATILGDKRTRFDIGLDLAVALPYPIAQRRPAWLGRLELRLKPTFFYARDVLSAGTTTDGVDRVSQRVLLTPLNVGFRLHASPRQRFTFYMGPRWDVIGYGVPGQLAAGKPSLAPIYSESWFDLDIPIVPTPRSRQARVVGQLTLGYIHSRAFGNGLDFGPVIGFFGQLVTQFALRIRPQGSPIAYQIELGARIGTSASPYLRVGVVLPDIGGRR